MYIVCGPHQRTTSYNSSLKYLTIKRSCIYYILGIRNYLLLQQLFSLYIYPSLTRKWGKGSYYGTSAESTEILSLEQGLIELPDHTQSKMVKKERCSISASVCHFYGSSAFFRLSATYGDSCKKMKGSHVTLDEFACMHAL